MKKPDERAQFSTASSMDPAPERSVNEGKRVQERHPRWFLPGALILAFLVRWLTSNPGAVLRKDAFLYFVKAVELAHGNFAPLADRSIGLSFLAAPWLYVVRDRPLLELMPLAKICSITIATLLIVPLYGLSTRVFDSRRSALLLALAVFSTGLVKASSLFLTEAPFMLFMLTSLYWLSGDVLSVRSTALSALFGGLCYHVRPNGIVWLAVIIITVVARHWPARRVALRHSTIAIIGFLATAWPVFLQRSLHAGGPFEYSIFTGPLAKTFSDPESSLSALAQGVPSAIFDIVHAKGVFQYSSILSPLLLPWCVLGVVRSVRARKWLPINIAFGVFLLVTGAMYGVLGHVPRHISQLEPLLLMYSVAGLDHVWTLTARARALLFAVYALFSSVTPAGHAVFGASPLPGWTTWVARHLEGTIVVVDQADHVAMQLDQVSVSALPPQHIYRSPRLTLVANRNFADIDSARAYYRQHNVDAIVACAHRLEQIDFLREAFDGKSPHFAVSDIPDSECRVLKVRD